MNAPAARPSLATLRASDNKPGISNRELELLEPVLTYSKQPAAPRSNRELSTVLLFGPSFRCQIESRFDLRASLFSPSMCRQASSSTIICPWPTLLLLTGTPAQTEIVVAHSKQTFALLSS